jgi:hypothetical protein
MPPKKFRVGSDNCSDWFTGLFCPQEIVMRLPLALALLLACSTVAVAAQAPYYLWQGKHRTVCAQTSPGKGWTKVSRGFVKSDCSV